MSIRSGRFLRSERGQALTEFALVMPIVMLMIIGLAEFARAWNTRQVLTDAAREALRSSVVANPGFSQESMQSLVDQALLRAALDPAKADVVVDGFKTGTGTPARIRIDYLYELEFLAPFAEWATGGRSLALTTSFVMRNE